MQRILLLCIYLLTGIGAYGQETSCFLNVVATPRTAVVCAGSSVQLRGQAQGGRGGGYRFTWAPAEGLSNAGSENPTATPTRSTIYTLTVSDPNGCTGSSTVTVDVVDFRALRVMPSEATICNRGAIILTASGADSYRWAPLSAGLNTTVGPTVTATPSQTTTYTLTGTMGSCFDRREITVTVLPAPTVRATAADNRICSGNSTTLRATGARRYIWSPNNGLSATQGATVGAAPRVTTTYTVVGYDEQGTCGDTATVTVEVTPEPTYSFAQQLNLCRGNRATLTVTGGLTYRWEPATIITGLTTTPTVTVQPLQSTTLTVTVGGATCSWSRTVRINVTPLPALTVTKDQDTICTNTNTRLRASGADHYQWQPETGLSATSGATVTANPAVTTTYTVIGTTRGCDRQTRTSITVFVRQAPTVFAEPPINPANICANAQPMRLYATGAQSYTWAPRTGIVRENRATGEIFVKPERSTTYTVTGTSEGCSNTNTIRVNVLSLPTATLTIRKTSVPQGTNGSIEVFAEGGQSPYTFALNCNRFDSVATFTNLRQADYRICVRDFNGCEIQLNAPVNFEGPRQSCDFRWAKSPNGLTRGNDIATSRDGSIYVVGSFSGIARFQGVSLASTGNSDIFLAKYNPAGELIWVRKLGSTQDDEGLAVATDNNNNAYITGYFSGRISQNGQVLACIGSTDVIVARFSASGNLDWMRRGGGNTTDQGDFGADLAIDGEGNVVVVGSYRGVCSFDNGIRLPAYGDTDIFLAKFTPTGGAAWAVRAGGAGSDVVNTVAIGPRNDIYLGGSVTGTARFGNVTVSNPLPDISDLFIARYSIDGALRWVRRGIGQRSGSTITDLVVSPEGAATMTGLIRDRVELGTEAGGDLLDLQSNGASDVLIARINPNGGWLWGNTYGSDGEDAGQAITADQNGTLYVTGSYANQIVFGRDTLNSLGSTDIFVAKVLPSNQFVFAKTAGSSRADDAGLGIAFARPDNIYVTGNYFLSAQFGEIILDNPTTDVSSFVAKLCNVDECRLNVVATPANDTICVGSVVRLQATARGGRGRLTYRWEPSTGLDSTGLNNRIVLASPRTTTNYTVFVTDSLGCVAAAGVTINVLNANNLQIIPTRGRICLGETINLQASGATSYRWSPGRSLNDSTSASVVASPTRTTTYTLTGIRQGCIRTTTVTVRVEAPLTVEQDTVRICRGSSAVLRASGADTIVWQPAQSLSASLGNEVTARPTTTTTYTVSGLTRNCQINKTVLVLVDTINVRIEPLPQGNCVGDSVQLTASGGTLYRWAPDEGLPVVNGRPVREGNNLWVKPRRTTIYTVTAVNGTCTGTATIRVVIASQPRVNFVPAQPITCPNAPIEVTVTDNAQRPVDRYDSFRWEPAVNCLDGDTCRRVRITPATSTTYLVSATRGGCTFPAQRLNVTVSTALNIEVSPVEARVCAGTKQTFRATGAETFTWEPAEGVTLLNNGKTAVVTPTRTTIYTLVGTTGNCQGTKTVQVEVNPRPRFTLTAPDTVLCRGNRVTLSVRGNAARYMWSPADGLNTVTGVVVQASPFNSTEYTVVGYAQNGCTDTLRVKLEVIPEPRIVVSPSNPNFCEGGSSVLVASGAEDYSWAPDLGLSATTGSTVVANPPRSIIYTVTGRTGACTIEQFVTVRVNVKADVALNKTNLTCPDCNNGVIVVAANGGTPPYRFSLNDTTYQPNNTFANLRAGLYRVWLLDAAGCKQFIDTVRLTARDTCPLPAQVLIRNLTATTASVLWQTPVEVRLGVELRYRAFGDTTWQTVTLSAGQQQYLISLLRPNTVYEYRLRSLCRADVQSGQTPLANFRTLSELCAPPTNLALRTRTPQSLTITWVGQPAALSYTVSYRPRGTNNYISFTVNAPTTSTTLVNLQPSTAYEVRIRSRCEGLANSEFSPIITFTTASPRLESNLTDVNDKSLCVYPNPSQGSFSVNYSATNAERLQVSVIDLTGKVIYNNNFVVTEGHNTLPILLNTYTSGVYLVRITTPNGVKTARLVLE